ncbi:Uncharacterised protein [Bordetella pertussis]|nr:Uncharacterised protein [Bordetella pertussis]
MKRSKQKRKQNEQKTKRKTGTSPSARIGSFVFEWRDNSYTKRTPRRRPCEPSACCKPPP